MDKPLFIVKGIAILALLDYAIFSLGTAMKMIRTAPADRPWYGFTALFAVLVLISALVVEVIWR